MKPRRFITPYMGSTSPDVNASLSLLKIYKRIRLINPAYKPGSRYQAQLKSKQAAHKVKLHIVR